MKKLIILLSALTMCSTAHAQLKKGQIMTGGSFNYQNSESTQSNIPTGNNFSKTYDYNSFTGALRLGYFIKDNFMLGVFGSYEQNHSDNISNQSNIITSNASSGNMVTAGVFSRYYKQLSQSRFAVYGELSLYGGGAKTRYSNISNNQDPLISNSKSVRLGATINPGITYFVTNSIAVEVSFGSIGYTYQTTDAYNTGNSLPVSTKTDSRFNSHLNFSLNSVNLGINFYFGKKGKNK